MNGAFRMRGYGVFAQWLTNGAAVAVFLFAYSGLGRAQTVTAAITGKITDASGALIGGAKVTATDVARGTVWPTTTNEGGVFNLPRLPSGTYTVKIEKEGFQTAQRSNVLLQLNDIARLDIQLEVGSITQSLEVAAESPLLQTQGTQLGQVIDSRTNTELPLATRNYLQLTLLAPGSIHPDPSAFKSGQTTASSARPNVNGNREQANNFMLDGLDNNQVSDNLVGYAPAVDAIQEFNEITLNAPAEFGNYMGGIISATIKSGTNDLHGSVFEFLRNNVLDANNFFNNRAGRGFSLDPAHPNCIAPGRRTMHTLNAYMVYRDSQPWLVGGTPGGDQQAQWNTQMISNVIDHGMSLQEAVEAPRFHSFPGTDPVNLGRPPVVKAENRVPEPTRQALTRLGHTVETVGAWGGGGAVQLIQFDHENGVLRGATDPRPGGLALGF